MTANADLFSNALSGGMVVQRPLPVSCPIREYKAADNSAGTVPGEDEGGNRFCFTKQHNETDHITAFTRYLEYPEGYPGIHTVFLFYAVLPY